MFKTVDNEADKRACSRRCWQSERGFTSIEMAICCLIIGIAMGGSLLVTDNVLPTLRADSSLDLVSAQLHQAREEAMDERRSFIVTFKGTDEITVYRVELPIGNQAPTQTLIADVFLEQPTTYTIPSEITQDTPDLFDPSLTPVCLGNPCGTSITFQSDGTAVTTVGNAPVNGTVFMATSGNPLTARAVTVLGATGQIQGYRYNGTAWGQ